MHRRRLISWFLSIVMLVGSASFTVLADDPEEQTGDPVAANGEEPGFLGDLTEGEELLVKEKISEGESRICTFTPEVSGRYGFICSGGLDLSVTVEDEFGTQIVPQETYENSRSVLQYMQLEAGTEYIFHIQESDEKASAYSDDTYLTILVSRAARTLTVGETSVFTHENENEYISFTPEESGIYIFRVTKMTSEKASSDIHLFENDDFAGYNCTIENGTLVYAQLTSGVTYRLRVRNYIYRDTGLCDAVRVSVSFGVPELHEGRNEEVSFKSGEKNTTFYSFTPEETDVYLFESEGDYSTGILITGVPQSYPGSGVDNNFRLGAFLEAGKKYTCQFYMMEEGEAVIPVNIRRADRLDVGETKISVDLGEMAFYAFTPPESGYYAVSNTFTKGSFYCRRGASSSNYYGNNNLYYFEKGELYYFYNEFSNDAQSGEQFSIIIQPVTPQLVIGGEGSTLQTQPSKYAYAVFTAPKNGTYTFTHSEWCEEGLLYTSSGDAVYRKYDISPDEPITQFLYAGETYQLILSFRGMSTPPASCVVTVSVDDSIQELQEGKNTVVYSDSEATYYKFTPSESGFYYWYFTDSRLSKSYITCYDGSESISAYSDSNEDFRGVFLTSGKEYTFEIEQFSKDAGIPFPLYIWKAQEMELGTNPIDKKFFSFCATFTPSESGVYGFYADDLIESSMLFEDPDARGQYNFLDYSFTGHDGISFHYLEKGVMYMAFFSKFGQETSVPITVTQEPNVVVGTNSVHLAADPVQYDMNYEYSYYTFVAPSDGNYTFRTEQEGNVSIHAVLMKVNTGVMWENGTAENNGNISFSYDLEAGGLYRLQLCQADNPTDIDISLIIEKTVIPEARLEGYSLSLDGSIGVNLYMALDESITSSDSSVLWITFPNSDGKDGMRYWVKNNLNNTRVVDGKTYYVFRIPVAAKEMTDTFTAQIIDSKQGFEGKVYNIKVQDYADYIIKNAYYDDGYVKNKEYVQALPLITAMLNYGARAQTYFGYKADDPESLANSILSDEKKDLAAVNSASLPQFDSETQVNLPQNVTFAGASLVLESETTLKLFFEYEDGLNVLFTEDENSYPLGRIGMKSGKYHVVSISGIPANQLDREFTMYVFVDGVKYSVTYSPIYYCRNVLFRPQTSTRTPELKELMAAFYLFSQQAKAYLNQ